MSENKGLEMKYFVLKPSGDNAYARASRKAMVAYGEYIERENPELAEDLYAWVKRCRADVLRVKPAEQVEAAQEAREQ